MRLPPPRPRSDDERILPLINVVFLLLIFFMLAGRLAAVDPFEITPPRSASEGAPGAGDVLIQINAEGRIAIDGAPVAPGALERRLDELRAGGELGRVRLKADGAAEAAEVVAVMRRLGTAGIERLHLLTLPHGAGGDG